jgi:hypothetical protein
MAVVAGAHQAGNALRVSLLSRWAVSSQSTPRRPSRVSGPGGSCRAPQNRGFPSTRPRCAGATRKRSSSVTAELAEDGVAGAQCSRPDLFNCYRVALWLAFVSGVRRHPRWRHINKPGDIHRYRRSRRFLGARVTAAGNTPDRILLFRDLNIPDENMPSPSASTDRLQPPRQPTSRSPGRWGTTSSYSRS